MTRDALEALAVRWIGLWTAPVDWAAFEALHADDFEDGASVGRPANKAGFAEGLRTFIAAFPDLETRIEGLVIDVEAQRLAVRWIACGNQRGRFLGVEPAAQARTIRGIEIIEVADGRIVRRWGEWDFPATASAISATDGRL